MKVFTDGDFDYGDECGIGSSGCVYKATLKSSGRQVAIKKLNGIDKNEASVWSTLNHPNIIVFLGIIKPPNFAIVTEFATHGNLLDYLADKSKPLNAHLLMKWIGQITQGMDYLHSREEHVIHRDLKSPNILLDENYNVKLCDFGTAKKIDTTTTSNAHNTVVGSYPWMAPEVMAGKPYSGHTDKYSYAVVLWELITRLNPFESWNNPDIMKCINLERKRLPLPEGCPQELADIIEMCWNHQSEDRPSFKTILQLLPQPSEEFLQRLQNFLDKCWSWRPAVKERVNQLLVGEDKVDGMTGRLPSDAQAKVTGRSNVVIQNVQGGTFYLQQPLTPERSPKRHADDDVDGAGHAKRQKLGHREIKPLAVIDTLVAPRGVKTTGDGKIIVNLGDNYQVLIYEERNHSWSCIKQLFGTRGSKPLQFNFNTGLALNSVEHLLIADTGNDRIQEVTTDGQFVQEIGRIGKGHGELSRPFDVAVDRHDNMYVCDLNNHRIQVFQPEGSFLRTISSGGAQESQLQYPLSLDVYQGVVYVTGESNFLQAYDLQGQFKKSIGGTGSAPGQFSAPKGVAVDRDNSLILVADSDNSRVQIFNLQMEYLTSFGDKTLLGHPHSVAVLQDGRIVVSDYAKGKVVIFPSAPHIVEQTQMSYRR